MQLTLNNDEIHQALTEYVNGMGIDTYNKNVAITLTNKRKTDNNEGGSSAVVDVTAKSEDETKSPDFGGTVAGSEGA